MPMVIARASDFALTGNESREELDENKSFFSKMESIRLKAAKEMGMGDCSKSVTPKFGLVAPHDTKGHIITRYFMPWTTHPTMAVTGSQCMASCALAPGTIADGMMKKPDTIPATITLHHPMGVMDVLVDYRMDGDEFIHQSAGLVRTARKLAEGTVFIPQTVWP
jgi:2-methylaconitate cis-trans-isomerase PrpF